MSIYSNDKRIYIVRSLAETKKVIFSHDCLKLKNLLLRVIISMWVLGANALLRLLEMCLFGKGGSLSDDYKDIVIYTVGILGDNVVMLPALAAIRLGYPKATIALIINCQEWSPQPALELVKSLPHVDRFVIVENYDCPVLRHGWRFSIDVPEVKGLPCDLFVNLSPFGNRGWLGAVIREMILAKLLGAKKAVGFHMSTLTRRSIFNSVQHHFVKNEPRRSAEVLKQLGLKPVLDRDVLGSDPGVIETVISKITAYGGDPNFYFVINPGAKFKAQCWPARRFGFIAKYISGGFNASVIVTGTADEWSVAEAVVKAVGTKAINMAGETTVRELIELLRGAKGCVTNDTGTMHIAALAGVPTVGIFSCRFSPTHWLPLGRNVASVFSIPECRYCYNDFCETPVCLSAIEVDDVISGLKQCLANS